MRTADKQAKNVKASSKGNIFIEMLKEGGEIMTRVLQQLFNKCLPND